MSITSQNLVNAALMDLGRIAPGETPSVAISAAAFIILNEILSSWSRDGQIMYFQKVGSTTLTPALDTYTIGVGGNFVTAAYPQHVKGARCSYQGFQQGVDVMPMEVFQAQINNPVGMTAALIKMMGVDNGAPLRNARVWPIPNVASSVEISWWEPFLQLVDLTTPVTFAVEGMEYALRAELVVALCPMFGLDPTTGMAGTLQRSKARITDGGVVQPAPPPPQQGQ